jgi:hypothetical protein
MGLGIRPVENRRRPPFEWLFRARHKKEENMQDERKEERLAGDFAAVLQRYCSVAGQQRRRKLAGFFVRCQFRTVVSHPHTAFFPVVTFSRDDPQG